MSPTIAMAGRFDLEGNYVETSGGARRIPDPQVITHGTRAYPGSVLPAR